MGLESPSKKDVHVPTGSEAYRTVAGATTTQTAAPAGGTGYDGPTGYTD